MKKILITLLILITAFTSYAQFPNTLRQSNRSTLVLYNGGIGADSVMVLAYSFPDTTAANAGFLKGVGGAIIRTDSNKVYMRSKCLCEWKAVGVGGTGNVTVQGIDSVVFYPPNLVCTWEGGASNCFPLDQFFDSVSQNYNNTAYVYYNAGLPVDSVGAITGVPEDSIFFTFPIRVTDRVVYLPQVSSADSGWVAPGQKVDSSVLRGTILRNFSDGDSVTVGTVGGSSSGIAYLTVTDDSILNVHTFDGMDTSYVWRGSGGGSSGGRFTTNGYGTLVDSATADLYRIISDTSVVQSKVGAALTYQPIITTSGQTIVATAGQTAFTFTAVPPSYTDYDIFLNGGKIEPITYFTTSGNIVTFTTGLALNDRVYYVKRK